MAWMFSPTGIVIIAALIVVIASLIYWKRKPIKKWLASRKVGVTIKAGPVEVSLADKDKPEKAAGAPAGVDFGQGGDFTGATIRGVAGRDIRLYAAQADATSVIAACLEDEHPSVPALTLAIECLEEAREVQPEVRTQLEDVLAQGVEDPNGGRRRIVAEALLALRLRRMVRVDEDRYVDNSLITHAEYELFLDERRAQGKCHQPDHWSGHKFPPGQGRTPVVGVRPSDAIAFCQWLTQREPGEWRYRLPMAGELDTDTLTDLAQARSAAGLGYWVVSDEGVELVKVRASAPGIEGMASRRVALDLDRARDLDRAHDRAHDRARARALDLGSDLDLARARVRDLARDLALDRALDLDRARDRARALDRDLDRDRVLAHDRALARALDLNLDRARDLARDRVLALDLDLARDLARDLKLALARNGDQIPGHHSNQRERADFLRWCLRLCALVLAIELRPLVLSQPPSLIERLRRELSQSQVRDTRRRLYHTCLDWYTDLAILEERIQGNLPAFEGIRIVKER